jgi:hypothetical protein
MKESSIDSIVSQKLNEFESLKNIEPSPGWNRSLINRLASLSPASVSTVTYGSTRFIITVLFFILINFGFILNSIIHNSHHNLYKDKELETISQELLINPVSIKN